MNWAHVHLIINHIPVIGILFDFFLLAWAMIRRSEDVKRVSLGILVVLALFTPLVFYTGGKAAHLIHNLPGVDPARIGQHDDAALLSAWCMGVLGAVALAGLYAFRKRATLPNWFVSLCLVLTFVIVGLMGWTAELGGRIRLPEARPGFTVQSATSKAVGPESQ